MTVCYCANLFSLCDTFLHAIARQADVSNEIDETQAVAALATTLARLAKSPTTMLATSQTTMPPSVINLANDHNSNDNRKRPYSTVQSTLTTTSPSTSTSSSHFGASRMRPKIAKNTRQLKIWSGAPDPDATTKMDVAVADMIHSNCLPFNFGRDLKFMKVIQVARTLPADYVPPYRSIIGGKLLQTLYEINWCEGITMLLADCHLFGIVIYGDGATIKNTPMINALAAGVNNPFALLDVFDCSEHCSNGGKKDASYIANLFLPLIQKLENSTDKNVRCFECLCTNCIFILVTNIFLFVSTNL